MHVMNNVEGLNIIPRNNNIVHDSLIPDQNRAVSEAYNCSTSTCYQVSSYKWFHTLDMSTARIKMLADSTSDYKSHFET